MTRPTSLSAVLPAYNEEGIIAATVIATASALQATGIDRWAILVVDDGSSDATAARCHALQADLPTLKVISHPRNRGYGGALRTGFEAAQGEAILLMDSDGQFDPNDLELLAAHWGDGAVVCGQRVSRADPLPRRLNHWLFFRLVRLLLGPTAKDANCGFKLMPRSVCQGLRTNGAVICTELLVCARRDGHTIVDVPVPHHPRTTGQPTGARIGVILHAFVELWQLRRLTRAKRPESEPPHDRRA
jgi:glycosyltransferase involved in cell wall biosynthesis